MNRHTGPGNPAMRPSRLLVLAALVAVVVASTPSPVSAHDLRGKATVTPTEVRVVAGYDDDTPADGGKVAITTADGKTVAEGVLDATGSWAVPLPPPGTYLVVVNDIGHRDRFEFTVEAAAPGQPPPAETTYSGWRLDKTLGLAIGLGLLLGGSLLYAAVRRRSGGPEGGPPA